MYLCVVRIRLQSVLKEEGATLREHRMLNFTNNVKARTYVYNVHSATKQAHDGGQSDDWIKDEEYGQERLLAHSELMPIMSAIKILL